LSGLTKRPGGRGPIRCVAHVPPRVVRHGVWWWEAKFLVAVAMVVFRHEEVLWLCHSYRREVPWGLPTGFVQRHETLEAACTRELREETGLVVPDWTLLDTSLDPRHRRVEVAYWTRLTDAVEPTPRSPEIADAGFFPWDAPPAPTLAGQRRLVEQAARVAGHRP
jgi:ADP-ribose pyrophosphatase YjhB (NUDIX family)